MPAQSNGGQAAATIAKTTVGACRFRRRELPPAATNFGYARLLPWWFSCAAGTPMIDARAAPVLAWPATSGLGMCMAENANLPQICWRYPPMQPVLLQADLHVWRASLEPPAPTVRELSAMLDAAELKRSESFYFARDRSHFIVARGLLRMMLGGYLNVAPERVQFAYNPYGKPELGEWRETALEFNVSHSDGLALYAFTTGASVGVDVERIRLNIECDQIAQRFFTVGEYAALTRLPPAERYEAFFHCWTRKEAYAKARGQGLSLALNQFEVTVAPEETARLVSTTQGPQETARWSLQAIDPGHGYVGALAVEGHDRRLIHWHWPW